ncbi:MAG: MarR family transcriptional regulator [Candidatus Omnitrophica bacterium]|nr:MarR family transcriptional regulator [Candidatus Omnitrophota bacterium]
MSGLTLRSFADKVCEVMPVIGREFFRTRPSEVHKAKLTMPQFIVLDLLARRNASNMTDIAHYMSVSTAAVTGMVDRLVRERYVVRKDNTKDRRITTISLTDKGARIAKVMADQKKKIIMKIFSMISQKEREEYLQILFHIQEHLKQEQI